MDDERLKNGGSVLMTEYFDRLLEQILMSGFDKYMLELEENAKKSGEGYIAAAVK